MRSLNSFAVARAGSSRPGKMGTFWPCERSVRTMPINLGWREERGALGTVNIGCEFLTVVEDMVCWEGRWLDMRDCTACDAAVAVSHIRTSVPVASELRHVM